MATSPNHADNLIRHRRQVSTVLALALAVSVAANVAAAEPDLLARCVSAWPPLALLLTVDVASRAPKPSGWLRWLVDVGIVTVSGVAAVVSFSHMKSVALAAGESELVAHLFPLSVDGLALVSSLSLVEIARRLSTVDTVVDPEAESVEDVAAVALESVFEASVSSEPLDVVRPGALLDGSSAASGSLVAAVVPEVAEPEQSTAQAPLVLFGN